MKVDDVGFVSTAYDQADNLSPAAMLASTTADATTTFRPRFTINGQVVCSSVRVPVIVTVTTPPAITLSGNPAVICAESNSAPVTVTAGGSNYNSYTWTPSTVTGNLANGWVFNPLTTTTYTLAAAQTTGATPCATTATITVSVNPTPSVLTISPSPVSTCADTILPLVSSGGTLNNMTLINQDFNGANNWTTLLEVLLVQLLLIGLCNLVVTYMVFMVLLHRMIILNSTCQIVTLKDLEVLLQLS
jgi:hypothetical protein